MYPGLGPHFLQTKQPVAIPVPFCSFRRPFLPIRSLQATLFPCAVLLFYSKCDLASSSSPLWWPGYPASTVLQTLCPTQERCTCGGWAPLVAYGICIAACWRTQQTWCYWLWYTALSFLIGFWLTILMQCQKYGLFRKAAAAFAQIYLYMFTTSTSNE